MRFFYVIFIVLLFFSCRGDDDEIVERLPVPKNLIPQKEMTHILLEMSKLEGHIQSKYGSVDKFHIVMLKSGDSLLKTLGVTPEQYQESLLYYGSRQTLMQEINDDVLDELTKELGGLEEQGQVVDTL